MPRWLRARPRPWPQVGLEAIKPRARVLVVDDSEFPYLVLFKRDEYQVDKWNDVDDLPKLEAGYYDVILLDIQGVGAAQSADHGLGVLKHLKRVAPAQIIVAYSNADYALKYKEFFDLADAALDKRSDYVEFKRTIDQMLLKRFSLGHYLNRIASVTHGFHGSASDLRDSAEEAILRGETTSFKEFLERSGLDADAVQMALQIVQAATGILQLLRLTP